jgi:hypothetical protein
MQVRALRDRGRSGPPTSTGRRANLKACAVMGVTIRGVWLTDPTDGVTHAWNQVVTGGMWQSRCPGREAVPEKLEDPEDEYGRCLDCALALALDLGVGLADRQAAVRAEMRADLRDELHPPR